MPPLPVWEWVQARWERWRGRDLEESRLLKLYWNRAELKKELASLDQQKHQLRDRLKQQEAMEVRLLDEARALEDILGRADRAPEVLVYYQLRALWKACFAQLEQLSVELIRTREKRERDHQLEEFALDRARRLAQAQAVCELEAKEVERLEADIAHRKAEWQRYKAFWYYFRRQKILETLEKAEQRLRLQLNVLADAKQVSQRIASEPQPQFPGLSLDGRRGINLALIAQGQLLISRLSVGDLARQAWSAQREHVRDCRYGGRQECEQLMQGISRQLNRVRDTHDALPELKARAEHLRQSVRYAQADDSLPVFDSLPGNEFRAESRAADAHVLRDNYWDIFKLLRT